MSINSLELDKEEGFDLKDKGALVLYASILRDHESLERMYSILTNALEL